MTDKPIKKLILGITGGVAAYKVAELVRLLVGHNTEVQVVMTAAAQHFITPTTMQALSGQPVCTDLWDRGISNGMAHIELSRRADAILVAPASANFIAKLAHGMADDLLSTLCLARDCPLLIAPAMNRQMWEHPATQRNVTQLKLDGVQILGPASGIQACGEIGWGRMLESTALFDLLRAAGPSSAAQPLTNRRILVTAGPTVEAIDPVRVITNLSSGKMGYALATAAQQLGAEVTLISGPTRLDKPANMHVVDVCSAAQMLAAVMQHIQNQDIFISVAAVADYQPATPSKHKLKKSEQSLTLKLTPTQDILTIVSALQKAPFCVGFAAESEHLLKHAESKRQKKGVPLLVANLVQETLGQDQASVVLLDDNGRHPLPRAPKSTVAHLIMQHIAAMVGQRN